MKALLIVTILSFPIIAMSQTGDKIQGSWELKSYINHPENGTEWEEYGDHIIYQKHIAGDHFTWIKFNTKTKTLEGMGGGSYFIDRKGRYVENLDFFYPPGSSELGQAIPFTAEFKGKNWYHTGYAKVMDIGLEGESMVVDSAKIEEIWKPIKAKNKNMDLVGTWELQKYMDDPNTGYMVYPEIIGYMKIITGSHFAWIQYDKEGDQIYAAGTGTYTRNGDSEYTEHIKAIYPETYLLGKSIEFECTLNGHRWKHYGETKNGEGETYAIDEYWTPKMVSDKLDIFD